MSKQQPPKPLVTSVSSNLKKTFSSTQVATPDEIKAKKRDVLNLVDKALELFKRNLADGKVSMNSSLDLERIAKLMLVLSGEPDSVSGRPTNEQSQETLINAQTEELSTDHIEDILDDSDPAVKSIFEKLYKGYNEANDKTE